MCPLSQTLYIHSCKSILCQASRSCLPSTASLIPLIHPQPHLPLTCMFYLYTFLQDISADTSPACRLLRAQRPRVRMTDISPPPLQGGRPQGLRHKGERERIRVRVRIRVSKRPHRPAEASSTHTDKTLLKRVQNITGRNRILIS